MKENTMPTENGRKPEGPRSGEEGGGHWRRFEQLVPEAVRRTLLAGVGAVFMTEEGLRNALGDLKLPKEAMSYVLAQADRSKRDLMQTLARELRSFLAEVDVAGVMQRVLAGMSVEFEAKVRFVPEGEKLTTQLEVTRRQAVAEQTAAPPRRRRSPAAGKRKQR